MTPDPSQARDPVPHGLFGQLSVCKLLFLMGDVLVAEGIDPVNRIQQIRFCRFEKCSLYRREYPAGRCFGISGIIQTPLQEPHGHDTVVLDKGSLQVVLLFPVKALVAGMKDGEIRLKKALPFLGVFWNELFQGGDDE